MDSSTPSTSIPREALAREIAVNLKRAGFQAYLVGGCVRDRLLGVPPKDYDLSTDARPDQILHLFPKARLVGAHFGVVLVSVAPDVSVEVATFRSEGSYSDGRRPDAVQFETDPALDAQRRDFTINGLLQDPETEAVLDFVGGRADLNAGLVRAIGNPERRFLEDHLRMLRAVRFASRLGFVIEANTLAAIRKHAESLTRISAERIRDELFLILTQSHARRGLELLDETGLLDIILPEVKAFQGVQQPPEYHPEGDVWKHVLLMLDAMDHPTLRLAAGVLFHDVGKPATFRIADRIRFDGHAEKGAEMTKNILQRLHLSNDDTEQITALVANHMRFKDVENMRPSTLKRFLALPHFDEHLELHRLDCLASNGYTRAYEYVVAKQAEFGKEELHPKPLIDGKDLIAAGFTPGPAFSRALTAVQTAQLEGDIQTKEQALQLATGVLGTESATRM